MNEQAQTNTLTSQDDLTKDFFVATFVVSIFLNLLVATTWMVVTFANV